LVLLRMLLCRIHCLRCSYLFGMRFSFISAMCIFCFASCCVISLCISFVSRRSLFRLGTVSAFSRFCAVVTVALSSHSWNSLVFISFLYIPPSLLLSLCIWFFSAIIDPWAPLPPYFSDHCFVVYAFGVLWRDFHGRPSGFPDVVVLAGAAFCSRGCVTPLYKRGGGNVIVCIFFYLRHPVSYC